MHSIHQHLSSRVLFLVFYWFFIGHLDCVLFVFYSNCLIHLHISLRWYGKNDDTGFSIYFPLCAIYLSTLWSRWNYCDKQTEDKRQKNWMQVLYTILSFILLIKLSIEGIAIFLQQKLLQPCLSTLLQKLLQQFAILGLFGSSTTHSDISNTSLYHP